MAKWAKERKWAKARKVFDMKQALEDISLEYAFLGHEVIEDEKSFRASALIRELQDILNVGLDNIAKMEVK